MALNFYALIGFAAVMAVLRMHVKTTTVTETISIALSFSLVTTG